MHSYRALSLSCLLIFSHAFAGEGFPRFMHGIFGAQKSSAADLLAGLAMVMNTEFFKNPLNLAISGDDIEGVRKLAQSGQRITGEHLHFAVFQSVERSINGDMVKLLIDHKAPAGFKPGKNGTTSLMMAARGNRPDLVEMLHDAGAVPNVIDNDGDTALHYAARCDADDAARYLLENGAYADPFNYSDCTPAHIAAASNSAKVLHVLAGRANFSLRHPVLKKTPLAFALWKKSEEAALMLIEMKAGIETPGSKDKTPLHMAAGKGLISVLRALLPLVACDVQDARQRTPLVYALLKGQAPTAEILIDTGVLVDPANLVGNTALHVAAAKDMVGIVRELLARGAKQMQNMHGKYPKDYTANPEIFAMLELKEEHISVPMSSSSLRSAGQSSQSDDSIYSEEGSEGSGDDSRSCDQE